MATYVYRSGNLPPAKYVAGQLEAPLTVSGLHAWIRSDSVVLNGSDVAQWTDKSGNDRHAVQASPTAQALWVASDPTWGGQPSVSFDGGNHYYSLDSFGPFIFGGQYTVLTVHDAGSGGTDHLWCGAELGNFTNYVRVGKTNTELFIETRQASTETEIGTTALSGAHYSSVAFDKLADGNMRLDGATEIASFTFTQNPTTCDVFTIGAQRTNGLYGLWGGKLVEMIMYERKLSLSEIQSIEAYFVARYGL